MKNYLKKIWLCGIAEPDFGILKQNLMTDDIEIEEKTLEDIGKFLTVPEGLLLAAAEQNVLDLAKEKNIAAIGYQRPGEHMFLRADMVVEGFEEVDFIFLEHVYERHHNIPWTILETGRLVVRELDISDLDELFKMYAEKGMTDYMEGLYPYEKEKEYQKAYIENMYRFYGYGMWLVFEKQTKKLVGRAGIEHREELGNDLELGYAVRTSCQRKGYAYEVCSAILHYAKEELFAEKVHCLIEPENEASVKLAEKLKFHNTGSCFINGKEMLDYVRNLHF